MSNVTSPAEPCRVPLWGRTEIKGYALVDAADYERVMARRWTQRTDGYVKESSPSCAKLHRFILGEPDQQVDHIDGNRANCCRSNLRLATPAQNASNRGPSRNNKSGYKGVCQWTRRPGKWMAQVGFQGSRVYLGEFDTPEEAARAHDAKARELHGEFARLNFPDS